VADDLAAFGGTDVCLFFCSRDRMGAVMHQSTTTFSPAQELKMVPSGFRSNTNVDATLSGPAPCGMHQQAGLPVARATQARGGMTVSGNERTIAAIHWRLKPMRVLLAAHAGLFADAFSGSLAKLARRVQVERCDPGRLDELDQRDAFSLVVIDADAAPLHAASLVRSCRERLPGVPVVALANALDDGFIAGIMNAGAQAYLPKSYREAQALGVLEVVLDGASHRPHPNGEHAAAEAFTPAFAADAGTVRRGVSNAYSLTGRELQVLAQVCEGRSNLNIAKRLGITEGTVKIHLSNSYKKLGVENRTQAIRIVERVEQIRNISLNEAEQGLSLRDWLLPHMSDESHHKGEVLFRKGDPASALYYIQQGRVALPEIGKQMAEGTLFGEIGIFAPEHSRTCSARCETDARLFCLTAERARRLYFENPQFAYHVMQLIAQHLLDDQSRRH
jgi:two-component system, NarL family, nitrate/nitrite response regulator NarL